MPFEPEKITKEHVLEAVKKIDSGSYAISPATKYHVVINGKQYPPKELMRFAHELMNGEYLWQRSGGEPTNKYLKSMGFEITEKSNDPIRDLIRAYKGKIRSQGNAQEIYKWQLGSKFREVWNAEIPFAEKVSRFQFSNLLFYNAIVVLKQATAEYPVEVEQMFRELFNEASPLQQRIDAFRNGFKDLYARMGHSRFSTHQDGRTMATYLTFYNPEHYTYFKDSFYRKYCKLLNIKPEKPGKKYPHYLELVKSFIEEYINDDKELLALKSEFLNDSCDPDANNMILAQDILYQTLDTGMLGKRNYWRIGTTEGEGSEHTKWESMLNGSYVSIGWPEIGDLNEYEEVSRASIQQALGNAGYYDNGSSIESRKAGEILTFYESIKIGDIILAQEGQTVLAIGEVVDDYEFLQEESFPHIHRVNWKVKEPDIINQEGLRTTVYPVTDADLISKVDKLLSEHVQSEVIVVKNNIVAMNLNTILYGPPGTGKTYNSIYHALSIIEDKSVEELKKEEYEKIKERFDHLLIKDFKDEHQKGRIAFVTFHQSMSYEDFIEGIKPDLSEEGKGDVSYEIKDGIFKYLSTIAKIGPEENVSPEFDIAYAALLDFIKQQPHMKYVLYTLKQEKPFTIYINSKNNLRFHANTAKAYEGVIKREFIKTYLETGIAPDWIPYTSAVGEFMKEKLGFASKGNRQNKAPKPYVLIIDEINRGNVSQILGELITLIEQNKRQGNREELGAILTYSKEYFTVPSNLYIIGTMNTADRSVEALDTALRRRFDFLHTPPDYKTLLNEDSSEKTVVDVSLRKLLETINNRISYLLDADHEIGHSYFCNLGQDDIEGLKHAFGNKIIPLLKEYFYNDYEKILLVLGEGFVTNTQKPPQFAGNQTADIDKITYGFIDATTMSDDNFVSALKKLLNEG